MKKLIYIIIALCVLYIFNENLSINNDNKQLIKFVKIVFKDKEEYYEQKENLCIDGEPNENISLYKVWSAS